MQRLRWTATAKLSTVNFWNAHGQRAGRTRRCLFCSRCYTIGIAHPTPRRCSVAKAKGCTMFLRRIRGFGHYGLPVVLSPRASGIRRNRKKSAVVRTPLAVLLKQECESAEHSPQAMPTEDFLECAGRRSRRKDPPLCGKPTPSSQTTRSDLHCTHRPT